MSYHSLVVNVRAKQHSTTPSPTCQTHLGSARAGCFVCLCALLHKLSVQARGRILSHPVSLVKLPSSLFHSRIPALVPPFTIPHPGTKRESITPLRPCQFPQPLFGLQVLTWPFMPTPLCLHHCVNTTVSTPLCFISRTYYYTRILFAVKSRSFFYLLNCFSEKTGSVQRNDNIPTKDWVTTPSQ